MKTQISSTRKRSVLSLFIPLCFALLNCSGWLPAQDRIEKYFVGIELRDVLCGYSEVYVTPSQSGDASFLALDQKTYISFRALGQDLSQKQVFTYRIDPATGNFMYHDSYTEQGDTQMSASMTVEGDSLFIQPEGQAANSVFLPENTVLPNTMFFPHLKRDFGIRGLDSCSYRMLNVRTGKVEDFVYHRLGDERIELVGSVYEAVVVEEKDPATGLLTTYWIDKDSGLRLKRESGNGLRMYLTDLSAMERLSTGNADDLIFVRTNEWIADLRRISSMRVQADLDAFPVPGMEDLNVEGQSFEGTIDGNSLKGIFEVGYRQYKGEDALSFGKSHRFTEDLRKYLQAGDLIESGDPEIQELALSITAGSKDFWEATCRLSSWVAENIEGSVTGGSALETLHRGDGACGAQSMLLAALCRAAGIPARVVWGCAYTPEFGGSFGHHGWSEVYVGGAGWIPVDVTFHETDYVDSGHIRLGVVKTNATLINYREIKILQHAAR